MRRPERIPIVLEQFKKEKVFKHFLTDLITIHKGTTMSVDITYEEWINDFTLIREKWEENPDLRLVQVLISVLAYRPYLFRTQTEEDEWLVKNGYLRGAEILFWGVNSYDNKVVKTDYKLIKDLTTDHINDILKGSFTKNPTIIKAMKEELEIRERFDTTGVIEPDFKSVENVSYDYINPKHYKNSSDKEVWEMMVDIWGEEQFKIYCKINAFKYRMRAGSKPDQSVERDIEKAKWYENKIKELDENRK